MPQNIKDYITVVIAFSLGSIVAVAGSNGGYEFKGYSHYILLWVLCMALSLIGLDIRQVTGIMIQCLITQKILCL